MFRMLQRFIKICCALLRFVALFGFCCAYHYICDMPKIKNISRDELRLLLKISSGSLRSYISRHKLKESSKGFLNVYNPINQDWIINYCDKKGIDYKPIFLQKDKSSLPNRKSIDPEITLPDDVFDKHEEKSPNDSKYTGEEDEDYESYTKLRDAKLKKEVEKLEVETRLKNLELDKKKAKIIPVEFATEMTQRYLIGTCGGIVNAGNSLIESICDELDADVEIKLRYKKKLKLLVNDTINSKHKPVSNEIINYAKEYSLLLKW